MSHFDLTISGNVQGVGFRYSAKLEAGKLKLKGFIKNNSDGTVDIEVEGREEDLEKFISWCRRGTFFSKVKEIKIQKGIERGYATFEVL